MGKTGIPSNVLLFCSVMFHAEADAERAIAMLEENFGKIVFTSARLDFNYTAYYCREMKSPLYRQMVAFDTLVPRDCLPTAKLTTNSLEGRLACAGQRTVNLDPGLLSMENISLATTKPYSHRIYLSQGIWAEVTLIYQGSSYHPLEWTYPDYASAELGLTFKKMRVIYKEKLQCQEA